MQAVDYPFRGFGSSVAWRGALLFVINVLFLKDSVLQVLIGLCCFIQTAVVDVTINVDKRAAQILNAGKDVRAALALFFVIFLFSLLIVVYKLLSYSLWRT